MSKRVEGVVFKIYEREFRGSPSYTVKIDGDPIWYRAGNRRFAGIAEAGNRVAFNAEMNPDGTCAKIVGEVTAAAQAPTGASGTRALGGDRNNSIVYQSSRKDALAMVQMLLTSGAVALSKNQKSKCGDVEALLDRYTALFFDDVFTMGAVTREAEGGGDAPAATETSEEEEE